MGSAQSNDQHQTKTPPESDDDSNGVKIASIPRDAAILLNVIAIGETYTLTTFLVPRDALTDREFGYLATIHAHDRSESDGIDPESRLGRAMAWFDDPATVEKYDAKYRIGAEDYITAVRDANVGAVFLYTYTDVE